MSARRIVLRFPTTEQLSAGEQEEFVREVREQLSGSGIHGFFITCEGNGMIEWEGESDVLQDHVAAFVDDPRVSEEYNVLQDTEVGEVAHEYWHGHWAANSDVTL